MLQNHSMNYRDYYTTGKDQDKNSIQYKVRRYYESSAADYILLWTNKKDLAMHFGFFEGKIKNHHEAIENMNLKLAEKLGITKNSQVVDAGCGYGNNACWIAKNLEANVTAFNIVPYQIKMAEEKAELMQVNDKVKFELKSFDNTELADGSQDFFWAVESSVHSPNKANLIKEAYRVLKPGGRFIISEYFLRSTPPVSQKEHDYMQIWLDGWAMPELWAEEKYVETFENTGFTKIEVENWTEPVRPSIKRLERMCAWTVPFSEINVRLGIISKDRYLSGKGSLIGAKAFRKGMWEYKVIVGEKPLL